MLKVKDYIFFVCLLCIPSSFCDDCLYDQDEAKLQCNFSLNDNLLYDPKSIETRLLEEQTQHSEEKNFLEALKSLKITGKLKTLSNETFRALPKLEKLILSHNEIEVIPNDLFVPFKSLKTLDLSYNKIGSINDETFKNLNDLFVLDLSHNQIKQVWVGIFFRQTKLKTLNLSHNQISELKLGVLDDLKNLNYLDVSYNSIQHIPHGIFNKASKIETLVLDGNNLNVLQHELLDALQRSLLALRISNSSISKIPLGSLDGAQRLTHLDISKNPLENIKVGTLDSARDLRVLNASMCGLKAFPRGILDSCPKFHTLDLSYNNLSQFHRNMFSRSNRDMTYLNLSHNQLSNLGQGIFADTALRVLDISYNDFENLEAGLLDVETLEELYVQFNKITILNPKTFFTNSEKLKYIDVSHNSLININPNVFKILPSLKYFNTGGNPWDCKCLDELLFMLNSRNIKFNRKGYFDGKKPVCVAAANITIETCWDISLENLNSYKSYQEHFNT